MEFLDGHLCVHHDIDIEIRAGAKMAIEEFHCFSVSRAADVTEDFMPATRKKQQKSSSGIPTPRGNSPAPAPAKSFTRPQDNDQYGRKPKAARKRK